LFWLPVPFNKVNKKEVNVQYLGGVDGFWQLLQPVQWVSGEPPTTENIWLAQEDLCVKRELLRVVRQANELVGDFQDVTNEEEAEKGKTAPATEKAADKAKAAPVAKTAPKRAAAADELDHKRFRNPDWKLELDLAR